MNFLRFWLAVALFLGLFSGCSGPRSSFRRSELVNLEATGYCKCGQCCGWKRNLFFRPVYAYGPQEGQPKVVGVTACGTKAKPGTIAADTAVFPFGTRIRVPGYGWGTVEDRGGAIQGTRLDLFFNSHREALEWGRRSVTVEVIRP
ncbi:MAG: 3D (Asp-Asp-Asp) domain-containing protein [Verrucomicrobia bacterium]|jgi:3D (Asp-Asp-Asp) domain-containing protein|nr:MAG: 3D (Asp-Asp-Asp) domain-containing protein [Verrucomicrobiota bacterium]